jgi:hypothetical protein
VQLHPETDPRIAENLKAKVKTPTIEVQKEREMRGIIQIEKIAMIDTRKTIGKVLDQVDSNSKEVECLSILRKWIMSNM